MRSLPVVLAATLLGGALGVAPVTLARFHDSATTTATLGTATVQQPTGLSASAPGTTVTLSWTASSTTAAEGYIVYRAGASGGPYTQIATVTPGSATSTTDTPGTGTWYYALRSFLANWTSSLSNEAAVTVGTPAVSTGLKDCTSTASDTGGRNNGYEGNPTRGCVTDNQPAVDANTGTSTSLLCTDAGNDRHRFWDFGLGVPSGASSIRGITMKLVAGMNNNGGTSIICAQLSWDGGTTWTAMQQATLTSASYTTYTMGGPSDTWGRTWTAGQLANSSFRVRLVDVTNQPSKDFRLDSVQVGVTYIP